MSLITTVSGYRPQYLDASRQARFAEVLACMEADAKALFEHELDSCLETCASKKRLRTIDDLYHFRQRTRFLASALGRSVQEDVFVLSWQETGFRDAKRALRTLRRFVREDVKIWHRYDRERQSVFKALKRSGVTLADIGATPDEMEEYGRRAQRP